MQNNLKKFRKAKGFTQLEMADKLGYKSKSGYCQLENGKVQMTIDRAKMIAEILNVNPEDLFFNNDY